VINAGSIERRLSLLRSRKPSLFLFFRGIRGVGSAKGFIFIGQCKSQPGFGGTG